MKSAFPRKDGEDALAFANQMSGHNAHPTVNAVAHVCEAVPGTLTNLDLPIIVPRQ